MRIEWQTTVPIFKNPIILRQLGLAVGIPFGGVILLILILSRGDLSGGAGYALALIGLLLGLTALFVLVLYGGRYAPGFIMDETGVVSYTQAAQAQKNRVVNGLAVALGLLSGRPAAAGAGMLAASRQRVSLPWKRVRRVKFYPRQRTVWLRGGTLESLALFCTAENYEAVAAFVLEKTA